MEDVGIFYGHFLYFMSIWYHLCFFGIFFGFGMLCRKKSGNPGVVRGNKKRTSGADIKWL
jgi:hypothetical protein